MPDLLSIQFYVKYCSYKRSAAGESACVTQINYLSIDEITTVLETR